jgi:hypothetical protein
MKEIFFLLVCFGMFQLSSAQTQTNTLASKGPEGMWKCSAPDAPPQYQTFDLLIEKSNDQFTGKIIGEGGVEMPMNNVVFKDSTFEMGLFVESSSVTFKLKWDGTKLRGAVVSDEGDIGITAEKIEVTEKKPVTTDTIPAAKADTMPALRK